MEKKVYSYFSLQRKQMAALAIVAVIFSFAYNFISHGFFETKQLLKYPFIFFILYFLTQLFIDGLKIVVISDEGVKFYGLFYKERRLKWEDIKTCGLYYIKNDTMKDAQAPKGWLKKYFGPKGSVLVSSRHKENFAKYNNPNRTGTIHFPYREDVYNLVINKIEQKNS